MAKPTVCCVMLVNGREAMVRRAIKAFQAQVYSERRLLVWNTSDLLPGVHAPPMILQVDARHIKSSGEWKDNFDASALSIGALRNACNQFGAAHWPTNEPLGDIILHWDSDDWSHPRRIEEQVALLQQSGKECVGYREMLFWRDTHVQSGPEQKAYDSNTRLLGRMTPYKLDGEAWLYHDAREHYCVCSSFCYWREVWERHPFEDGPKQKGASGEENTWLLRGVRMLGITAQPSEAQKQDAPRMIASIHGDNTSYYGSDLLTHSPSWKRVPEWDAHCGEVMTL